MRSVDWTLLIIFVAGLSACTKSDVSKAQNTVLSAVKSESPPADYLDLAVSAPFRGNNLEFHYSLKSLIKNAFSGNDLSWQRQDDKTWILTNSKFDPMTNKTVTSKFLFTKFSNSDGTFAQLNRAVINGEEFPDIQLGSLLNQFEAGIQQMGGLDRLPPTAKKRHSSSN